MLGPLTGAILAGVFFRFVCCVDPVGGPNPLIEMTAIDPFKDMLIKKVIELDTSGEAKVSGIQNVTYIRDSS